MRAELGREHPARRRPSRMKMLAHRRVFVELPQAEGLGAGASQRRGEPVSIEAEEASGSRGRSEDSASGSVVEVIIMFVAHCGSDPDGHFVSLEDRPEELVAGGLSLLGHREGGRDHNRGRVKHRTAFDIVHLHDVREATVGHGRHLRRAHLWPADDAGGGVGLPTRVCQQGAASGSTAPGQRASEPIEDQPRRGLDR